jgi:hypothetical protein
VSAAEPQPDQTTEHFATDFTDNTDRFESAGIRANLGFITQWPWLDSPKVHTPKLASAWLGGGAALRRDGFGGIAA